MKKDILTDLAISYSPAWAATITTLSPNVPYFKKSNPEFGLMDAVAQGKIMVTRTSANVFAGPNSMITLGAIDKQTVRDLTKMKNGRSYSDIFFAEGQYSRPNRSRAGGSQKAGFMAIKGAGKRREGISVDTKTHPGVMAVPIFEDTLQFYKKIIRKSLKRKIKTFISEI